MAVLLALRGGGVGRGEPAETRQEPAYPLGVADVGVAVGGVQVRLFDEAHLDFDGEEEDQERCGRDGRRDEERQAEKRDQHGGEDRVANHRECA